MQQTLELSYRRFVAYAALAVGVVLVPVLIWQLGWILILGFAAILIAILLHVVSEPLQRWTPLPVWADLLVAGLIVVALVVLGGWIFGSQLSGEFTEVVDRVRAGAHQLQDLLHKSQAGQFLLSRLNGTSVSVTGLFGQVVTTFVTAIEALVVIVMSAAYLAAEPALYRAGVVRLFGPTHEEWANDTIVAVAEGLRYWLLGQFIEMALIGALTTLAVWLIGLPSPLALGVIATLTEFVPYLGPILAAIPALLVAVTGGLDQVIWTLLAYVLIHQVEGNLIMPQIQKRMVYIPPALMLLGIAGVGALAGILGFVFAAPMMVAIFVIVQKAYVRDTLKEDITLPGEKRYDEADHIP
jgi:predicted PurR-regulated permease PerM